MTTTKKTRVPSFRLHKATSQGYVELDGQRKYLGRYELPETREKYHRLIAEWEANGRSLPPAPEDLTVKELIGQYWEHAERYYVKNGQPTSELDEVRQAMKPLRRLYGSLQAAAFSPRKLQTVRNSWVGAGLARSTCNARTRIVTRMFRWGVENELIAAGVWQALRSVQGLKAGRSSAREPEPVRPVPPEDVERILPHLPAPVRAMVQLQLLTGARPGELVGLRPLDVDVSGDVWVARLLDHKTAHHGRMRTLAFGPKAKEILRAFMANRPVDKPLFSPCEAFVEQCRKRAKKGRRPGQPESPRKTSRVIGEQYTVDSYRRCITETCKKKSITVFTPHRLRHTSATKVRESYGLDAAQAWCGHTNARTAEIYAEVDESKAVDIARKIG